MVRILTIVVCLTLGSAGAHPGVLTLTAVTPARSPTIAIAAQGALGEAIDRDCGDFSSWREAQDSYEKSGPGDPHGLEADNDGIECEVLR